MQSDTMHSAVKGTLILIAGNIIVKIIGALFKLPLANIIGADGMGLYNASFIIYDFFLVIATSGFPLAISKMVAKSCAEGQEGDALKIFHVTRRLFLFIGIACSVIMFAGAKVFSQMLGNSRSYHSMLVLAPAVLFVSLMSSYRGYYQGRNDMVPTTISQVVEAVCRLIVGLSAAWYLKSRNFGIETVTCGAIAGITFGEFSSTFTLAMIHRFRRKKQRRHVCRMPDSRIIKTLFATSIPIAVSAVIISMINMLDNSVTMHRLQFIGNTEQQANTLYGCLNMAFTVFSLPITIVSAVTVSVFPMLSYANACRDYRRVSRTAGASLRMTMLVATASAALFMSLSYPLVNLIYFNQPDDAAVAARLLLMLGPSAVMISLSMLSTSILQAIDRLLVPSRSMIVGGLVCIGLNWVLVGQKELGIYATPIGIFACYTITAAMNMHAIRQSGRVRLSYRDLFYKPLLPAAVMAFTGIITFNCVLPRLGLLRASAVSLMFSGVNFMILVFLNNCIVREDLMMFAKGESLIRILEKLKLLPPETPGQVL